MNNKIFNPQSLKAFDKLLHKSQDIVLTCHVRPDGDAMGSTLGLSHLLKSLGKEAIVVTPDLAPRSLWFMPGMNQVVAATKYPDYARDLMMKADLILCCDFNVPSRQDSFAHVLEATTAPKVMIDHHEEPGNFAQITFSFPKMSSASELAFRLIAALGLYNDLTKDAATCLCTGLITDTRNFSVNCDNPETYEILMRLMEKGADKKMIVKEALETKSYDSLRLQAFALYEKLEVYPNHHAAVITLSLEEQARFAYERGDSEGLVNMPLQIRGVVYSFFLREEASQIKVSARSVADFPVNEICGRYFNGGGHIMAAGGEFREGEQEGRLQRCREILLHAMPQYDNLIKKIAPEKIVRASGNNNHNEN